MLDAVWVLLVSNTKRGLVHLISPQISSSWLFLLSDESIFRESSLTASAMVMLLFELVGMPKTTMVASGPRTPRLFSPPLCIYGRSASSSINSFHAALPPFSNFFWNCFCCFLVFCALVGCKDDEDDEDSKFLSTA